MKRVLLLGDSIRMGYDEYVQELLKDEYEVIFSEDNGRFALYTLWQANQMFKHYGHFDLVHWNNGYWDMNIEPPMTEAIHPLPDYVATLKRIIHFLRENGADIIFATSTPILEAGKALDNTGTGVTINYSDEWVRTYNAAACKLMAEEQIEVNDLYGLCSRDARYYKSEDMLHLTQEGYQAIARQTAELIRKRLG